MQVLGGTIAMNQYITGSTIKELRESKKLTQNKLAKLLNVSDKTISKWETGRGYPDISLLEPIAKIFDISIAELFSGNTINNTNISANIAQSKIYVCPICGNIICSIGETVVHCHGIQLAPAEPETIDSNHQVNIEKIEDEYFIQINHEMSKEHYISFIVTISGDKFQIIKLYPEWNAETRLKLTSTTKLFFYCNRDGLFSVDLAKWLKK